MGKRISLIVVAVAATGLIAAGCGSSSKNNTTASITKAEFIAKADAICTQGKAQLQAAGKAAFPSGKATSAELQKFAAATAIPNQQKQIDQIRALGTPTGDQNQVNAILDAAQKGIDAVKADPSVLLDAPKRTALFANANQLAQGYGLKVCGKN